MIEKFSENDVKKSFFNKQMKFRKKSIKRSLFFITNKSGRP